MSDPRVLITTYPTAFLHRGGGELELVDLQNSLRQLSVRADLYGPQSLPVTKYDTVLHYSVVPSGLEIVREAKRLRKKLLLMPAVWWSKSPSPDDLASTAEFLSAADVLIFKSKAEHANLAQYLEVDQQKTVFCRWGVDGGFDEPAERDLFKSTHKLKEYVLWVGLIDETKNQLSAIKALKDLETPVVFIGDYRDRAYYEACVSAAPPHFKFLPHLQAKSEMLRAAMQECKAYIELPLEPPGFSALEASLAKVPMVLSKGPWTEEHFGSFVRQVDPYSPADIKAAVRAALTDEVPAELARNTRLKHLLPQSLEPLVRLLQSRA